MSSGYRSIRLHICILVLVCLVAPPLYSQVRVLEDNECTTVYGAGGSVTVRQTCSVAFGPQNDQQILSPYHPEYTESTELTFMVDAPTAEDHTIRISFSIPEVIELSLTETEISFEAGNRPGAYQADDSLHVQVSTNTRRWRIVCEASPFQHATIEDCTIPLDRVQFKVRCAAPCNKRFSGKLAESVTLFQGDEPVSGLDIYVYFKIIVRPTDPAGIYTTQVTLRGEVKQ